MTTFDLTSAPTASFTTSREPLTEEAWNSLRSAVTGRLVTPADPDYDSARLPWTLVVDQRPAAILHCADADDIQAAVRWALDHDIAVTAQPTGHAGRATVDGTLLLRTGALRELTVDTRRRTARVGAGVKFGELMAALEGTGLTALCGSNPDPTVVGLALGGGVSWFSRKYGFAANSLVALDVVDAEGIRRRVDRATDEELFWALRGGGGDFAIVIAVDLALYPAEQIYGGQLIWSIEHAPAVLRAFRDLATSAPRELSVWAHISHLPDLPVVPAPLRGRSVVNVALTYLGSGAEAEPMLRGLRAAAPVEQDLLGDVPVSRVGDVAGEPTDPTPVVEHSMLLIDLDDEAIDALCAAVSDVRTCPLSVVQIRGLGGAFAERTEADGAVCAVTEPFQLFAGGMPVTPELAAAIPHGFADLERAVGRLASRRRMPNFAGVAQSDSAGYDPETLSRLRAIKQSRDPLGVIRSNKPVLGA